MFKEVMKNTLLGKLSILAVVFCCGSATIVDGQEEEKKAEKVNFRYSQNPKIKSKPQLSPPPPQPAEMRNVSENSAEIMPAVLEVENPSIARKTLEIAKRANEEVIAPTEVYKVGVGDVLFINLQNSPKDSTYYTVLNDGTIDYPLAGEMVSVAGLTTEEIEEILRSKIKLYENPQISVKIREYASHTITVLGLVEKAGEKKLQREAVPLYVVRAEAVVLSKATQAVIRRANAKTEIVELRDAKSDDVLIFPGDIIEFTLGDGKTLATLANFYYIDGRILSGGQKEFYQGITLTQAIIASGGLKRSSVYKIVIRRKNPAGLLVSKLYNLRAIKGGTELDPVLEVGDIIEVGL
jgi:polysaccharide export outer membrane protein